MLFSTPTQFAVLLLMLVIGWLFGFASHPGGRKWKQAYRDEQAARKSDVAERDARIRELEARNAELEKARTAAPVAASAAVPAVVAADAAPARRRGWFEWGGGDDLTRLRGVDADLAGLLKREEVTRFADVANLSEQDEIALERRIDLPAGYIKRERLREQARLLAAGDTAEHDRQFG